MFATNKLLCLSLLMLLAAACSKDEPAADVGDDENAIEEVVEEKADEVAETTSEATEEVQIVEESAAVPEKGDDEAIMLARADTDSATTSYKYKEGTNYQRMVPSQPTVGGADKVEVAEFFWYGCPHCYDLEPTINTWAEDIPANVRLVRIPAMWNPVTQIHAQLFYTEEVLVRNGVIEKPKEFRDEIFQEYHRRSNRMLNEDAIRKVFERNGVSAEDFDTTWGSFEVAQKMRVAQDLGRRYSIASVPMVVVNGKYRTDAGMAGSYPKLIEVIDELIARESAR
jgi:thiol:disulfide interchange protein DsbA